MNQNMLLFIQIQTLLQACTTSGKKNIILYAKSTYGKSKGDQLPMESPIEFKDNSLSSYLGYGVRANKDCI